MADIPVHVAPYFLYDFPEVPVVEMFNRIARTEADGIEFALLGDPDIAAIADRAIETGVGVGLLLSGDGKPTSGPALTDPSQHGQSVDRLRTDIDHAERLDCNDIAVLVGRNQPSLDQAEQIRAVAAVVREVAPYADAADVDLHIEPVSAIASQTYFLRTTATAADLVDQIGRSNVGILYDVYHQQVTEGNILATVAEYHDVISYFHVANVPDRGPMGGGELALENIVQSVVKQGHISRIGCEFIAPDIGLEVVDRICSVVDAC